MMSFIERSGQSRGTRSIFGDNISCGLSLYYECYSRVGYNQPELHRLYVLAEGAKKTACGGIFALSKSPLLFCTVAITEDRLDKGPRRHFRTKWR